jgi:hypothetical protein
MEDDYQSYGPHYSKLYCETNQRELPEDNDEYVPAEDA